MNGRSHGIVATLEVLARFMPSSDAMRLGQQAALLLTGLALLAGCRPTENIQPQVNGKTELATAAKTDSTPRGKTTRVVPRTPGPAIESPSVLDEETLARIDEAGDSDSRTRLRALAQLRDGPANDAPEVIAVFRRGLSDSDPSIRNFAVLGIFDVRDPEGMAAAVRMLGDSAQNPALRRSILTRLRELGGDAAPHAAAVGRVLSEDPDQSNRLVALITLERIGLTDRATAGAAVAPWLAAALEDSDVGIRRRAREALAALGPPAVPALIDALGSTNLNTQWNAIHVVQQIGPPAKDAAAALAPLAKSPNERVRAEAQKALQAIGGGK